MNENAENRKKEIQKKKEQEYAEYIKPFAPKPKYVSNSVRAFVTGGLVCCLAYFMQNFMIDRGIIEEDAGIYATLLLVVSAQLLTGIGVFDVLAKFAGAGLIVPITGFANSMVAPAIEFKKEGIVLGVGSKLFSIAGPVIVLGTFTAVIIGLIHLII